MELMLTWPETFTLFTVDAHRNAEQPAWFCPEQGQFSLESAADERDRVLFYWLFSTPVVVNRSHDYLCRVGEHTLAYGQSRPLPSGVEVQVGQYRLQVQQRFSVQAPAHALAKRVFSSAVQGAVSEMPEPDDLLSTIGYYSAWREPPIGEAVDDNPLKALAGEYKNVVLWGEQRRESTATETRGNKSWSADSAPFHALREQMEGKTVTECILATHNLMERVCEELDLEKQNHIVLAEEPKHDILLLLAPPHLQRKSAHQLPSLMLQEFYKAGLDTLL